MNSINKYSIILPVRNGGSYVKECINSILAQTFQEFDLIVLENKSTDGTREWLETLTDKRVRIYPADKPLAIADNWNRILEVEKNEFVTLIGHDDLLLPHYLEEMNSLIEKHPAASLYQSHFNFIDAKGAVIRSCLPMDEVQQATELLAGLMAKTIDSMGSGYLFRAKDYDNLGGISPAYPDLLFADHELWVSLTAINYKATAFNNCFSYRLHQSLSRTTSGMNYYQSFNRYILFLHKKVQEDAGIKEVMLRYGKNMLNEYCEAVAHRLLKTPVKNRTVTVKEFVTQCQKFAAWLIPGQDFNPLKNKRIQLAVQLDSNKILRNLFQFFRRKYSGKL